MAKIKLDILFEDEHLIALNKTPGVLTLSDRYAPDKLSLHKLLEEKYGHIFIVHRLDKETSGVILFAKNAETHRALSMIFEKREVRKFYTSLLEGNLYKDEFEVDKPIAPSSVIKNKMVIHKDGKEARSIFRVIKKYQKFSLVEVEIFSGRTHQIRVHAESIGYPLVVDSIYGKRAALHTSEIKGRKFKAKKDREERPLISRSILHASKIIFKHPANGEEICIEAAMPKDFRAVVNQLNKWSLLSE